MYSLPRIARGACAAIIGKVTDTRRYVARYRNETVMDVDLEFLTGGVRYSRPYVLPEVVAESVEERDHAYWPIAGPRSETTLELLALALGHRDVSSRASIYRRYDGVVRGCTAVPPGHADAGVLVPIAGSPLAVAVGIGGNPRYGKIDPRKAAELAVIEAIGQVTAVGATPAGLTDCLNFGDPTVPEQMGAFVAAIDGLSEAAKRLAVPFVSGNVSLYNRSSSGNHVAPSPIVGCVGVLSDVSRSTTGRFRSPKSDLVFVGNAPMTPAVGGSVLAELKGVASRTLPAVNYAEFQAACAIVREGIARGIILSARDVSDGGILVAATEMAFATDDSIGFSFDDDCGLINGAAYGHPTWFGEHVGFVVEVHDYEALLALPAAHGLVSLFGKTIAEPYVLRFHASDEPEERVALSELREAWEAPLRDFYGASTGSA